MPRVWFFAFVRLVSLDLKPALSEVLVDGPCLAHGSVSCRVHSGLVELEAQSVGCSVVCLPQLLCRSWFELYKRVKLGGLVFLYIDILLV